jgi:hypothetical protein
LALARHCEKSHKITVIAENEILESRTGALGIPLGPWAALFFQMYSESGQSLEQHSDRHPNKDSNRILPQAIGICQIKVFEGAELKAIHSVPERMLSMSTLAAVHDSVRSIVASCDISIINAKVTGKRDNGRGNWAITYEEEGRPTTKEADILVLAGDAYAGDRSHLREYRGMPSMSDGLLVWHGILPVTWEDCAETPSGCLKELAPGTLVRLLMGTPNHSIVL